MFFLGVFLLLWCGSTRAFPAPIDTVIVKVQQWGVVGAVQVNQQVVVNGVSLTSTDREYNRIAQIFTADALLSFLKSINQTSVLRNHTVLHCRECILEGSRLYWKDHVDYDGKVYLTLDDGDIWTAQEPGALALKMLWDQQVRHTETGRIHLEEECLKIMRELKLSQEQSVPGIPLPQVLIPVLAVLAFTSLIVISLLLSKNHGLRHPGGVIGSIIHYPKDMEELGSEVKTNGYRTL